jgi:hypothetical protein
LFPKSDIFFEFSNNANLFWFSNESRKSQNIIRYYKEKGHITDNLCNIFSKELFVIEKKKININFDRYDHENIGLWCDPNYYDRRNPYPINKGDFSFLLRCLYGKEVYKFE